MWESASNYCAFHKRTQYHVNTPSLTFQHHPPNSARIGYATEGALFISAHLSTDAVSSLQKAWVLIRLWKQSIGLKRTHKHEARTALGKN